MFGKLPEIFGRDFAIGYFLPFAIFLAVSTKLISRFGVVLPTTITDIFTNAVVFALLAWFGGIFLLAINRSLIRTFEGYGRYNPARLFKFVEKYRFKKLNENIKSANQRLKACTNEEEKHEIQEDRIKYTREAAVRFPDIDGWILPTSFGNTIRAFEVYPRVIYGADSIQCWNRLLAVISKDYRELIDAAKAQVDFWINLSFLSVLYIVEYFVLARILLDFNRYWVTIVVAASTSIISYKMARDAAVVWGDFVKSAFDVYLPELRKKLEFAFPKDKEREKTLWTGFSQSILYRNQKTMPEKTPPRK